jgi:thiol-disulfide isomerase/thioredoxin
MPQHKNDNRIRQWFFILSACLTLFCCLKNTQAATVGDRIEWPDMVSNEGRVLTKHDFTNHYVMVQFWATWCPYCSLQNATLQKLQPQWEGRGGRLLTISVDKKPEAVSDYLKKKAYRFTTVMSNLELKTLFGKIKSVPTLLIVAPDGTVLQKIEGQMLDEDLMELLDRLPKPRAS